MSALAMSTVIGWQPNAR